MLLGACKFLVISNLVVVVVVVVVADLTMRSSLHVGWFTWGYPQEHNEGTWQLESTWL